MVEVGVLFVSQLDPDTVLVQVTDGHVTCMRPPPLGGGQDQQMPEERWRSTRSLRSEDTFTDDTVLCGSAMFVQFGSESCFSV